MGLPPGSGFPSLQNVLLHLGIFFICSQRQSFLNGHFKAGGLLTPIFVFGMFLDQFVVAFVSFFFH